MIDCFGTINKSLSNLHFEKNRWEDLCQKGKQVKTLFKTKYIISTNKPLQLLRMDFFSPSRIMI